MKKNRDFYNWAQWWCDENSDIFHFMAEDNVYFYTVVENFLIQSWNEKSENKINYPNYFLIPIPIPNTTAHIDLGYVVMAIFAYLYGPIAGGLIGGMGRFLEDMILFGSIGSPGWLIASILMGMLIGLTFKFTQKGDNPQIALMIQIILILIINAVLLIGLSPFISSLWHGVPYITKLPSGLSAFLTNSFAIIVIGIPIGRILEKMLKKS